MSAESTTTDPAPAPRKYIAPKRRLSELLSPPEERERRIRAAAEMGRGIPTFNARVDKLLSRRHSVWAASGVALTICLFPLLLAALIGAPCDSHDTDAINREISAFGTIAQVMGGVFAVLLAVVGISIQLHAQRDDESALLVPYLVHRHHAYWVASTAIGVTLLNLFAPVAMSIGIRISARVVTIADAILVPTTLAWSLWLLARTVADATRSVFDTNFPAFQRDVRKAVAEDERAEELLALWRKELERTRVGGDAMSLYLASKKQKWQRPFLLLKQVEKYVADIDLEALATLDSLLRGLPKDWECHVGIGPCETIGDQPALIIVAPVAAEPPDEASDGREEEPAPPRMPEQTLTSALSASIQVALERLVVTTRQPSWISSDLNDFFDRFGKHLVKLARGGSPDDLETALSRLEKVVEDWCRCTSSEANPGLGSRVFRPRRVFAGPFTNDIWTVVSEAVDSDDPEKFNATTQFLYHACQDAISARHLRLFQVATTLLTFAHHRSRRHRRLARPARRALDGILHGVLVRFSARRRAAGWEEPDLTTRPEKEQPLLDIALAFALDLILSALEHGRRKDALQFIERLFEHRKYQDRRTFPIEPAPIAENSDTLHDYALITIVGWTLLLLEHGPARSHAAAKSALDAARKLLPSRQLLVATWELYRGERSEESIQARLGVAERFLRRKEEMRPGIAYTRSGGNDWLPRGFYASLLIANPGYVKPGETYFAGAPHEHLWRTDHAESMLKHLAASPNLGIADEKREEVVADVLALISQRELAAKLADAERVFADNGISEAAQESYRTALLDAWKDQQRFGRFLRSTLKLTRAPTRAVASVNVSLSMPRESFIEGSGWDATAFAPESAEQLGKREDDAIANQAEASAEVHTRIADKRAIADSIRSALSELQKRGYQADVVIAPLALAISLIDKPTYEWNEGKPSGRYLMTMWEDLHLIVSPWQGSTKLLVMDSARFFGQVASEPSPTVLIQDTPAAKLNALRERVAKAVLPSDVPPHEEATVNVELNVAADVGVASATESLAVDATPLGYAFPAHDSVYHRLGCPQLQFAQFIEYSTDPRSVPVTRKRCPTCKPLPAP